MHLDFDAENTKIELLIFLYYKNNQGSEFKQQLNTNYVCLSLLNSAKVAQLFSRSKYCLTCQRYRLTSLTCSWCRRFGPCGMVAWGLKVIWYCLSGPMMPGMLPGMPGIMPG